MKYISILLLWFPIITIQGQGVLDEYIESGLRSNLSLIQKENNYNQSLESLREAKGLFYPSISLNARYTVSQGGRVIEFPVGDLLNGVYSTLNQLTASDRFTALDNEEIRFLRPTEHESKLRLVQPLFNTDIYYNSKIKKELAVSEQISLEQFRRELVTEIKRSYYTVAMTQRIVDMLKITRSLLVENVRINTRLEENDKVTRDIVLRSQTELHEFDQQLREAQKNSLMARAYFNFILNRTLTDSVVVEEPPGIIFPENPEDSYIDQAVRNREELHNLEQLVRISNLSLTMNQAGKLPDILLVADYGFQGERYEFSKSHDYIQASAVLSWDLFSGFQNRSRIKQSLIQKESVQKQLEEVRNRISLQVIN
ncbi:TolC family protein, partial [bacterium]